MVATFPTDRGPAPGAEVGPEPLPPSPVPIEAVIQVRGLRKTYGAVEALRGVDFEVRPGEIFALLGPNGAGKTTTTEILEGYRSRDGGDVRVLGVDPAQAGRDWRARIGIVLQTCQVEPELTVRESLELFAGYFPHPRPVDETIALVGLEVKRDARAGKLSGGQQRRLDVALGLIGDPELLFLDEPTTGFDPAARHQFWDVIRDLRALGMTVLLTTHYMDEAQALADRVAIVVAGQIAAIGRPDQLGGRDGRATHIRFDMPTGLTAADLPRFEDRLVTQDGHVEIVAEAPLPILRELSDWALGRGTDLPNLEVTRPSLEDIYLELTRKE